MSIQSTGLPLEKGMVLRIHPAVTFPSIQEGVIRITDLMYGLALYETVYPRAKEFTEKFLPKGANPEYIKGVTEKYALGTWVEYYYLSTTDPDAETPANLQYLPLAEFSTLISIF